MSRAARTYLPAMAAILVLLAIAGVSSWVILQNQGLRIPVIEERPFELRAEFETAQAAVAGQGQTIRVAGVRIGAVEDVELEDGHAVVSFGIDRDYVPIYRDATLLMRPQTGLKDMFFELDPGTHSAGEYEEGATLPLAATAPDVNLDEILAMLDADSRAYLRLLVVGVGEGIEGRGRRLGRLLGTLGPLNRDFGRLNTALERRDDALADLVHNLELLSEAAGRRDDDLARLVATSDVALGALAERAPDLRRLTAGLPRTLSVARRAVADATPLARELGPTLDTLRPLARRLEPLAVSTESLARVATPSLRDRLRPFVRAARPELPRLGAAAQSFAAAAPDLRTIGHRVNRLGNMTAYNPRGAEPPGIAGRDEGFLYWLGWFAHTGNTVFTGQDAHGVYRRLFLTGGCEELRGFLEESETGAALAGILTGLGPLYGAEGVCGGGG